MALGIAAFAALLFAHANTASAETRILKFYHLHTHERAVIAYKRDGRYLPDGLKKINHILRDWRQDEEVKMNPRLLDLLWQVYRVSGSRDYINVICGYRAPETNSMLRRRSSGVAKKSQHMLGNAIDFYLPDVKLAKLRAVGLKMQDGGVGYYPTSGSPFVHMDVASVRHWPRMSRSQLLALFPDGKTVHIPSDGKPLAGYNVALAAYKSRVESGSIMTADNAASGGARRGLLASLFGGGADEEEDNSEAASEPTRLPAQQRQATVVAAAPQVAPQPEQPRIAPDAAAPSTIIAALPEREIPLPRVAPRPDVDVGARQAPTLLAAAAAEAPLAGEAAQDAAAAKLVALNVPLPTWRPEYHAPAARPAIVAVADVKAVEDAQADAPQQADEAISEILKSHPRPQMAPVATAYLPVPGERPDAQADEAIPAAQSIALSSAARKFAETVAVHGGSAPNVAATPAGTPRLAMLSASSSRELPAAIFSGAKTTNKSARVRPADDKHAARAVVVPIAPDSARWALRQDSVVVAEAEQAARLPRFDASLVQSPKTVYTAGFRKSVDTADARRFSGSAVRFMSVARFASN